MKYEREIETSAADQPDRASGVGGAASDAFAIGELINERYSILTRISEGPTGKLYRSWDVRKQSEVTLKLLLGESGFDPVLVREVGKELSVTRALAGERLGIARVFGCDLTTDGRAFVVLESVEGRNLGELMKWREPLSVERALRLALGIAEGLHSTHNIGLVHGALGLEHVLVQPDDTVKVMGFEVARLRAAAARPPTERAEKPTKASDTQAVATMLLEMLERGVRPVPDRAVPHLDATQGGKVPPAVKELTMQALGKSPERPALDMGALAKGLAALLAPSSALLTSGALRRRARPIARQRQWAFVGAGTLALVSLALGAWMTWSLLATPRPSVTRGMPPDLASRVITEPVPVPGSRTPAQSTDGAVAAPLEPPPLMQSEPIAARSPGETSSLPAGSVATTGTPAKVRQAGPSTLHQPPATAAERTPTRPHVTSGPVPADADRSEPDAPDPSKIIDWLIESKRNPSR